MFVVKTGSIAILRKMDGIEQLVVTPSPHTPHAALSA
jgi:hypothetical protein